MVPMLSTSIGSLLQGVHWGAHTAPIALSPAFLCVGSGLLLVAATARQARRYQEAQRREQRLIRQREAELQGIAARRVWGLLEHGKRL